MRCNERNIGGTIGSERNLLPLDGGLAVRRGVTRLMHVISVKEALSEENYQEYFNTAKENLLDHIGDDRYNYRQDPVTREELDAYFHGGTIEYPRGNEIQIPAGTISEELYELAIQKLEEVEQAR
ncbi:hypothetical protein [Candidatus Absconditicoccus praedator]|uniref:hypothetical protein n=1 Tax=Candidatus Absconditicoccus praedator TaxID=2735562 RepID=UPI001E4C1983|nr:hypothetical protein [Candidatus Absconditicoccus praedator]UFX83384.1 hypothetical protein HLG78_04620 [Candidatus Absconditicoccus praedator]